MLRWTKVMTLVFGVLLATAASADAGKYERRMAQVMAYAGAPVTSIRYIGTHDWEALGDHSLLLWENTNRAYFVDLDPICNDLKWVNNIAVITQGMTLDAKFDKVRVDDQTCHIQEIRPIDVKGLKADEHLARAAKKASH